MSNRRSLSVGVWIVLAILLVSTFSGLTTLAIASRGVSPASSATSVVPLGSSPIHPHGNSNLLVNGGTVVLTPQGNGGLSTYPMSGNITVENQGVLKVYNMTVQFNSYTGTSCVCSSALLTRFSFNVGPGGHVYLYNSTILTYAYSLDSYLQLNLSITGDSSFTLTHNSELAFPGSVYVSGGSSLYLNNSAITANPDITSSLFSGFLPANVSSASSYAPGLTVSDHSQLVTIGGYLNGTFASSDAGAATLNETFVSAQSDLQPNPSFNTTVSVVGTPLEYDVYNSWSSADLEFAYTNPGPTAITATPAFMVYGTPVRPVMAPVTFKSGSGIAYAPLPAAYVQTTFSQGVPGLSGLNGLLTELSTGAMTIALGSSSSPNLWINQTGITATPAFQFDINVYGGSNVIALGSSFDVNWQNPAGVPAYTVHKFDLSTGSVAYLVNSSSASYPTNLYTNTSAFVPDATSNFYVFQFVNAKVVTDVGSPVEGAQLWARPALSVTNPNYQLGQNFTETPWLQANQPALYGALSTWSANIAQAPAYNETNAQGIATIAVITNNLTASRLPNGVGFGEYNMTVTETGNNIVNSTVQVVSARASSPSLCGWPYIPLFCSRPVTIQPSIVAPLLTADVRAISTTLNTADAASLSTPIQYFENSTVALSVQVRDANAFPVAGGSIPVYLYDSYPGTPVTAPFNITAGVDVLNTANFTTPTPTSLITIHFAFVLPYSSTGLQTLTVMVDPYHTTSWSSYLGKIASVTIQSDGSPFWSQAPGQAPTVGLATTTMTDPSTGALVSDAQENSNNSVDLNAQVTNNGDTSTGAGTSTVMFQLGTLNGAGQTVWTWVGYTLYTGAIAPGTTEPVHEEVSVLCSCETTVAAYVNYTVSNPGPNSPAAFSFRAVNPYTVAVIDYTSLSFSNENASLYLPGSAPQIINTSIPSDAQGVHEGQGLQFTFDVDNAGGVGTSASVSLELKVPSTVRPWAVVKTVNPFSSGGQVINQNTKYPVSITWHVDPYVIGQQTGPRQFALVVTWNNGPRLVRTADFYDNVTVFPSLIHFSAVSELPNIVGQSPSSSTTWRITGTLTYNTTNNLQVPSAPHPAPVGLNIYFVNAGNNINQSYAGALGLDNVTTVTNGTVWGSQLNNTFVFGLPQPSLLSAGIYTLILEATIGSVSSPGGFQTSWFRMTTTVGVVTPSTCSGFFALCNLTFLILIIAGVAVVAVVVAVLTMGRTGKGRLVECGECGELIPDNAPACPKCGAEFEAEMVRCSRCASTIPAASTVCPECSALLLGKQGATGPEEQARKDYAQNIERYRAEGRKELGETYSEGAFWDWWKRQPTYLSYSAFKLQSAQGTRSGMTAPQASGISQGAAGDTSYAQGPDMSGGPQGPGGPGGPGMGAAPPGQRPPVRRQPRPSPQPSQGGMPPSGGAQPDLGMGGMPPGGAAASAAPAMAGGMKSCSSCGREINSDFLVCPFCGAATR